MKQEIKNYKVYRMSLTTLSPIFIGSGEELNKSMYVYKGKEISVIDERKLTKKLLSIRGLYENFLSECFSGNLNLTDFLKKNLYGYEKMDIYKYNAISYSDVKTKGKLNNINTFIKSSNGNPYIPGSSIKGAIRTAIIANEIYLNKEKYIDFFKDENSIKDLEDLEDKVLSNIFSNFSYKFKKDDKDEVKPNILFKFLHISDTNEVALDNLFIGKQYDFSTKGNKLNKLPIFMEFIRPKTKFNFILSLDKSVVDYFDIKNIMRNIRNYFRQYFYCISKINELLKNIKHIPFYKSEDLNPNTFIGGHNGYLTKNILYSICCQFENNTVSGIINQEEIIYILKKHLDIKFSKHRHSKEDNIMSPRTLKLTKYEETLFNIGICNIKVEEELC